MEAPGEDGGPQLPGIVGIVALLWFQELQQLQRANQQLREEVRRLEETMAYNMVDCREMEAALRRVEEEARETHTNDLQTVLSPSSHRHT